MANNGDNFKDEHGYIMNGAWYPRVTSIINIKAKPALYRFYGGLNSFAEGEMIKQKSADEGTLVHEFAEKILVGDESLPPAYIQPSIDALRRFLEQNKVHVDRDWVEKRIVHYKERYAGTIDALALIGGKFGVLDIKTSQEIYRDYNLQTAAYFASLSDEFSTLQTRWILRIDQTQKCLNCGAVRRTKGGREKIRKNGGDLHCQHEWSEMTGHIELKESPNWKEDFDAFLAAKKLWEWENESPLKKIGYLR
ncbi:MAG: hypothetical protein A3B23_00695 [Candidatus Colwellbacteria bacterium RIFCSPLOWO2_01_FULL_48_10]|uniref:PD-(D/E)XK endonuclease-like domain-containing protein n=1 Tax=Candidatus Colwellbacteria bacterium RIFCSPLOWO2_01_FULL_48_10 TaxID=1797690 RepID=A0A1G1Z521_9BACT|nr:MAG: hypothetical protein A3B23_00695 [Candidatus Colwellbacteria bacterium RIFCSPLOWO2_01_FULL_48_10]